MTDKGWFGLSSFVALNLLFLSCACASAPKAEASRAPAGAGPVVELSSDSVGNGEVLLVRVIGTKGLVSGDFEGVEIPFYPSAVASDTWEGLVAIPFFHKPGAAEVKVMTREPKDEVNATRLSAAFTVVDVPYEVGKLTVAEAKLNPPLKVQKRIAREVREIAQLYRRETAAKLWEGPFRLPIESVVTSEFGKKRLYNNQETKFHQGLDLRASVGTPVHAPAGAVVVLAKDLFFTGYTVILDHGYGLFTVYAHMSKLRVKKGVHVAAGQELGLSGATGRAAGPHLHWGVVLHKEKVNPMSLMKVLK